MPVKTDRMPRMRRVVPGIYEGGEWRIQMGKGRASNDPTWHVLRGGQWHSSHRTLAEAREAIRVSA